MTQRHDTPHFMYLIDCSFFMANASGIVTQSYILRFQTKFLVRLIMARGKKAKIGGKSAGTPRHRNPSNHSFQSPKTPRSKGGKVTLRAQSFFNGNRRQVGLRTKISTMLHSQCARPLRLEDQARFEEALGSVLARAYDSNL